MIFDIGGRQNGKTSRLIEFLHNVPDSILIVPTEQRAVVLRGQTGMDARRIVTVHDIQLGRLRGWDDGHTKWIVDDLDIVLTQFIGGPIALAAGYGELETAGQQDSRAVARGDYGDPQGH